MAVIIDIATHERFNPEPSPPIHCPMCAGMAFMARVGLTTDMSLNDISEIITCVQCGHTFNLKEVLSNDHHVRDE